MSKGENIFKRKDGRWEARFIKGHKPDGKVQYGFCYGKTYKEAKDKVTMMRSSLLLGSPIESTGNRHRLTYFCDEWLETSRSQLKESTYVKYDNILNKHIKPHLGSCLPQNISEEMIRDFSQVLLMTLSPKTVKDVLVVLHSVLKFAGKHSNGYFPSIEIPYPKEQRKEMRVLTSEEQKLLTNRLLQGNEKVDLGIMLALLTGMRIGELCALRWEDVSLENKTIRIRATMQRIKCSGGDAKTKVIVTPPKSEKSRRLIPMTELAADVCMRMEPGEGYVLTGSEQYLEPRVMQYRLANITWECGLEGVHFHTLRHTFATRCVEVGFEIKSLSEILGHSATGITLDRYIHASLALKRENMGKLETIGM